MQKKLIALAVAAAAAAPAFAQSNVTIYGRLDMGVASYGSHIGNESTTNGIDSNVFRTSYLGFKGVEDLGNGLKAGFDLQYKLTVDSGDLNGETGNRDTFVFLNGGFGTVALGRLTHFQDRLLGSVDPMGSSNLTGYDIGWNVGAAQMGYDDTRLDNTIAYISPSFSGLTVSAAYSTNAGAAETLGNDADIRVWAISPVYKNGPITLGLNYHKADNQANDDEETVWDIAAAYDFGMVKLSAAYGQDKFESALGDNKAKQWFVGASAPVGAAGKVALVYGSQETLDDVKNSDIDRWALGYQHSLSKRTTLFAEYGNLDIEKNASKAGLEGKFKDGYERGVGVGMVHTF